MRRRGPLVKRLRSERAQEQDDRITIFAVERHEPIPHRLRFPAVRDDGVEQRRRATVKRNRRCAARLASRTIAGYAATIVAGPPASFVLIHGAWHGAWCWDLVAERLRAAGHEVIAPDLPGLGRDETPLDQVSLASWADFVADLVRAAREPVVLVGHSRGGVVVTEVAERVPERVRVLVYLTAFLLPDGKAIADMLTMVEPRPITQGAMVHGPNVTSTIAAEKVGPVFYNTTSPPLVERATRLVCAEPMMSFMTPVHTTDARWGRVRRAYVECLQDNAITIELQRLMQSALPCAPVVTLDTDHSPFFSAPAVLAAALTEIAEH
jgi:pimeloyl-ACP methyl ester carboxylesterase